MQPSPGRLEKVLRNTASADTSTRQCSHFRILHGSQSLAPASPEQTLSHKRLLLSALASSSLSLMSHWGKLRFWFPDPQR